MRLDAPGLRRHEHFGPAFAYQVEASPAHGATVLTLSGRTNWNRSRPLPWIPPAGAPLVRAAGACCPWGAICYGVNSPNAIFVSLLRSYPVILDFHQLRSVGGLKVSQLDCVTVRQYLPLLLEGCQQLFQLRLVGFL